MSHRIILYTHNRPLYFCQTMEALLFSLKGDSSLITVVLQDPDPVTKDLAGKFKTEVLETADNCAFAGMTIGVRWYQPTTITIVQDDLILPPMTNLTHGSWPYEFESMLKDNDIVIFGVSLINLPSNIPRRAKFPMHSPDRVDDKFEYFDHAKERPPLFLFQPCTMKTDFWQQCYNSASKCAVDSTVIGRARHIARSKLEVYHIGWNRDMNGYNDQANRVRGFKLPVEKTQVTNWKTGEIREITL